MVEIQLETYTPEAISAHRKIRQDIFCLLALYHPHGFNFVSQMPYISHIIVHMYLKFTLPHLFPKINTFFLISERS